MEDETWLTSDGLHQWQLLAASMPQGPRRAGVPVTRQSWELTRDQVQTQTQSSNSVDVLAF